MKYTKEEWDYYYSHAAKDEWHGAVQYLEDIDDFYRDSSMEEMMKADEEFEKWLMEGDLLTHMNHPSLYM
jgi:hypothetical protein